MKSWKIPTIHLQQTFAYLRNRQNGFAFCKMGAWKTIVSHKTREAGFTFVELIVVIGIFSLLLSIAYVSLSNIQIVSTNNSAIEIMASDIKTQQIKAMTGDTEGRGLPDNYGIKIFPQRYVFFHGVTYNPVDPYNFEIPIDTGYTLTSTFPQDMVLFASGSGELVGFVQNQNTISVTNTATGQSRTIILNKYGTITSIN